MSATPSAREQLDRLIALVRRSLTFWKRGGAVFLVGALLAVPYVFTRPRSYRSETVILYQETIRSSDVTGGEASSEGARRVGARLRELLLSRASLEPIIRDLNLYPTYINRGQVVEAVEEMRKNIVFHAQEGDTYDISFTGDTPKEVQAVTQRLGDCIIHQTETSREEKAKTLQEFLTTESARNAVELKQKEDDLAKFVVLHPEYALRLQGVTPTAPSAGQSVSGTTDPVLAGLESRALRIERQLAGKSGSPAPKPGVAFQPLPDSSELVAAKRDLADKLSRFTDKHPDVIAARSRLQAAEQAQAAANAAAEAAWERAQQGDDLMPLEGGGDDEALKKELARVQTQIAARRATLSGAPAPAPSDSSAGAPSLAPPELELEFRRLQREVNDGRDRQQQLEERLFRASLTASSVMDDRNVQVSVVDPAYLPDRAVSKPRSLLLGALLCLSIVLAIATAFVSAALDDRIHDRQDVERLGILPVVAIIPRAPPHKVHQLGAGSGPVEEPP